MYWVESLRRLKQHLKLRERLALVMGLFVLSVGLGATALMEHRLESALQSAAQQRLDFVAKKLGDAIRDDLLQRRREVAQLALVLSASQEIQLDTIQPILDKLKARSPAYAWIGLADAQGSVVAASDGLLLGVSVAQRPWFSSGQAVDYFGDSHSAKLLEPFLLDAPQGEPVRFFDITSPVRNVSQPWSGVLGAHLYTRWIRQVVERALVSHGEFIRFEVFVADGAGNPLYQWPSSSAQSLNDFLQHPEDARDLLSQGTVTSDDIGEDLAWTVAVRESHLVAMAPIHENRRQMLMATPVIAVLLAWATWLIAGSMARPVSRVAHMARLHAATAGHELDTQLTSSRDETQLLDQALNRLALTDPLTGLSNRSALKLRLSELIQFHNNAQARQPFAVYLLNLDDFHVFNSTKGHDAGDQLLKAVADRLRLTSTAGETLARLGGDEFVVLTTVGLMDATASEQAHAYGDRLLGAFAAPLMVDVGAFRCPVSIGVVLAMDEVRSAEDILTQAELAMQEAKRLGKEQIVVFNDQLQSGLLAQAVFEQELLEAIPTQLLALYQPQVDQSGQRLGVELLVRWRHAQKGLISPALFIPLAERNGQIVNIGRWVMQQACQQICAWKDDPLCSAWSVAVNVSAREFSHPGFVESIQHILTDTGANPARLKLELTESALAVDVDEVVLRMRQLRVLGITFALDDFGTGFSSLSYLQRMPIDQLKIDQSFVREMLTDANSASIVQTVVALGRALGLQVIAEGVETEMQRERLAELGCLRYQGYLFGAPMPAASLVDVAPT